MKKQDFTLNKRRFIPEMQLQGLPRSLLGFARIPLVLMTTSMRHRPIKA